MSPPADRLRRGAGPDAGVRPAAVWLPWVAAPAFFLLPIAGCGGMAALSRPPAAFANPTPGPVAPDVTMVAISPPGR